MANSHQNLVKHCCLISVSLTLWLPGIISAHWLANCSWFIAPIFTMCNFVSRVTLDMLSVQSNNEVPWDLKKPKAFWRGRDSRRERLDLIALARQHSHLINASLTNFFFFKEEEKEFGPKEKHISFFKFFNVKYYPSPLPFNCRVLIDMLRGRYDHKVGICSC